MRLAVCGGTGFIGSALVSYWLKKGHEVTVVTRAIKEDNSRAVSQRGPKYVTWDEIKESPQKLEDLDALVNLAGSTLNQRWTKAGKQRILDSRLKSVQAVADLVNRLDHRPYVIVQGSAVGIYGTSLTEEYEENSEVRASDFLSEVTMKWEHAARTLQHPNVRVVTLRTGVVLGNRGGAFPLMRLPFLMGVGGRVGTGQQWMSWIHLSDIVQLIDHCIVTPSIKGPINAVSPAPVTNDEFGRTVAKVYHRPFWFPLPAFLLKLVLGEQSTLLLDGQQVIPKKALEQAFTFQFPQLREALEEIKAASN